MKDYLGNLFQEEDGIFPSRRIASNRSPELYARQAGSYWDPRISAFGLLYFSTKNNTKNNNEIGPVFGCGMDPLYKDYLFRYGLSYILTLFYLPAWVLSRPWAYLGTDGKNHHFLDGLRNVIAFTGLALFYPVALTLIMHQAKNLSGGWQVVPGLLSLGARGALVYGFMSNHLMQDALQRLAHFNFQGPIGQVLPAVLILWATASLVLNDAMQIKLGLEKAYQESPEFAVFWNRTVLALMNPAYVFHKKKAGSDATQDQGACRDVWNQVAAIVWPTAALAGVGYALYQSNMMHQMVQSLIKGDSSHLLNDQLGELGVLALTVLAVGWAGYQAYAVARGAIKGPDPSVAGGGAAYLRGSNASEVDSSRQSQGGRSDSSNFLVSDSEDYDEEDYPRRLSFSNL